MENEIVNDSHIENDVEEVFQDDSQEFDVREAFGLPAKVETEEEIEEGEQSVNDKPPAKEEVTTKRVVKFNKEDREIDESEVEGLLQKGLALDKVREGKTELEKTLERVAKLEGLSVADYLANLDKKEAEAVEKEKTAYDDLRKELREQAEDAGLDPDKVQQYLDNHPLMKQAQEAITERDTFKAEKEKQAIDQEWTGKWNSMYSDSRVLAVFPDIIEDSKAFERGESPNFLNADMQARLNKGYDPLDALLLAHSDKFQGLSKKATEQKLIKQQQLSSRSKVADDGVQENRASEELRGVFAMFGIDPKRAQKYAK